MKLKLLDALLRLYEQNFRNLHWNSVGEDFNDSHKSITTEYYEMLSKDVDFIAEVLCMYNTNPVNYMEAAEMISSAESKYLLVESGRKYTRKEICEYADVMFKDICKLLSEIIAQVQNPMDAGIKSELETMLYRYTLQSRYINARRLQ